MTKEWLIGAVPILVLFLIYLGYNVGPILFLGLIVSVVAYLLHRQGALPVGRSKRKHAREVNETGVTFDDIGGLDKPKQELKEAIDLLKEDERARKYGIRPLKGILLTGPPGTGKTLIAKAAANYADAAFVAASGSEFVEMYVGVGASRIRDLFKEVKQLAREKGLSRGIIFIDEIDVIGGKRDGQQQKEYDQTLNQLLTEMDGISTTDQPRILLIAATNRVDMLDPALLRPGRFDRLIRVDLPDKKARRHILQLHFSRKPLADNVNLDDVAKDTYGFSGAQLESVANEAAIYAFRSGDSSIDRAHIAQAIEKVMMGEQTDKESTEEEKRRVAYHELGHAICSEVLRPYSVSQVVLIPRGGALGYVRQSPPTERHLYTKSYIEEQIMICLAGAAAEEIYFGERSTGSKNDFDQALGYVQQMIETGLSRLGIVSVEHVPKARLQEEMTFIFDQLYERTKQLLLEHNDVFTKACAILLQEERLSGDAFRQLLTQEGKTKEIS
ncbi:ATP-dependent metalloprotease FtsH [Caldalkalibacillus uzonensis]|uniref:ATP-dependent metalloprotease FtsH n=1 Tax=Caldalkalibacillus uzonensis TaxID=353224 RepID=A0ABU0CMG6_9BACI|nr:AAA family ATPase [Caldalkalibacillus uzonensis]MDQ0337615.1 ATP-dependent metalloprotease FtsH [Caldalkalibacillus uzonensis]